MDDKKSSWFNTSALVRSSRFVRHANSTFNQDLWDGGGGYLRLPEGETLVYQSPFIHRVVIDGLKPDTAYEYAVGASCEGADAWSRSPLNRNTSSPLKNASFTTPPAPGVPPHANDGTQVIAIVGDVGQTHYSNNTIQNILKKVKNGEEKNEKPETLWILGDLSYADGDAGVRWDTFQAMAEPLTSALPTLVMVGNHEVQSAVSDCDAVEGNRRGIGRNSSLPFSFSLSLSLSLLSLSLSPSLIFPHLP